jgi:hypothetical protein
VILEIREYVGVSGRFAALPGFFDEHTRPVLAKHGMQPVQAGSTLMGETSFNESVYTIGLADLAEVQGKWAQVVSDLQKGEAFAAAEAGGPLVQFMKRRLLNVAGHT